MLSKSAEIPEGWSVHASEFVERSSMGFPSSSFLRDNQVARRPQHLRATNPDGDSNPDSNRCSPAPGAHNLPEIPQPEEISITISVIEGRSKGMTYRLSKLCITMGRIGGGADFEFDEPEASDVHCIIGARQKGVRLYVAPFVNNIYVNNERVYTVELAHMSTFRVGSSLLLVRVLPTQCADVG